MNPTDNDPTTPPSLDHERKCHNYLGNSIPWFVRLIWVGFWCFVIYYTLKYLIPDLQLSLFPRPQ
jgi:hypothetical protein